MNTISCVLVEYVIGWMHLTQLHIVVLIRYCEGSLIGKSVQIWRCPRNCNADERSHPLCNYAWEGNGRKMRSQETCLIET